MIGKKWWYCVEYGRGKKRTIERYTSEVSAKVKFIQMRKLGYMNPEIYRYRRRPIFDAFRHLFSSIFNGFKAAWSEIRA